VIFDHGWHYLEKSILKVSQKTIKEKGMVRKKGPKTRRTSPEECGVHFGKLQ
jgi:hypothetical protein